MIEWIILFIENPNELPIDKKKMSVTLVACQQDLLYIKIKMMINLLWRWFHISAILSYGYNMTTIRFFFSFHLYIVY